MDAFTLEHLEPRIERIPFGGCWIWMRSLNTGGYGEIGRPDPFALTRRVHRIVWELTHGPIPEGLLVCHRCDVRSCVNPDHLFLGTYLDNAHDAMAKGRVKPGLHTWSRPRATHCKYGHAVSGFNAMPTPSGYARCRLCSYAIRNRWYAAHKQNHNHIG